MSLNTSKYAIFEYWKDKTLSNGEPVVPDWGEPMCWGCRKQFLVKGEDTLLENGDFKKLWNNTSGSLQRCHIVAKSLGGSDETSNLFLLCSDCHYESPDTTYPRAFFGWVEQRESYYNSFYRRMRNELKNACKAYGMNREQVIDFLEYSSKANLEELINFDKVTTHSHNLSLSSIVFLILEGYLEKKNISEAS